MSRRLNPVSLRLLFVAAPFLLLAAVIASCGGDDPQVVTPPVVLQPPRVIGFDSARPGAPLTLCLETPGAGPNLEYQFDFDIGGILSDWSADSCRSHGWAFEGQHVVRARVREGERVSDWSEGWKVTIIDEFVSPPNAPTVDPAVVVGNNIQFCAAGAASSKSHTIEYRFRVDPDDVRDWHISRCTSPLWMAPGRFRVRAQARCLLHNGIFSPWSQSVEFMAISAADTRIVRVLSGPTLDLGAARDIDFRDADLDTVPIDSWLTVVLEGSSPVYSNGTCTDPVNQCVGFQMKYESARATVFGSRFESLWLPELPFDSNTNGLQDTVRLNIGSLEYLIQARAVDEFGPDAQPAWLPIYGNFAPTLDDFSIQHHDGTLVRDGETLSWDWWAPANSDTIDIAAGERKKQFSFAIKATGHDDPRDPAGSAIKSWRYLFTAADDDIFIYGFARAGFQWVPALQTNALCDTFTWTVRYPMDDVNGDTVFSDLPAFMRDSSGQPIPVRGWDFSVRGRDSGPSDEFQQYVLLDGEQQLVNQYNTRDFGRRTSSSFGFQRFFITLTR